MCVTSVHRPKVPNTRIYQTSERQTFHTDSAHVVGLLCIREDREGGRSLLVSAETIYNRMRELRPDLLEKLFDRIATDRSGEVPEGAWRSGNCDTDVCRWCRQLLTPPKQPATQLVVAPAKWAQAQRSNGDRDRQAPTAYPSLPDRGVLAIFAVRKSTSRYFSHCRSNRSVGADSPNAKGERPASSGTAMQERPSTNSSRSKACPCSRMR